MARRSGRNPGTVDDVPDVVNCSWGYRQEVISCLDIFWKAIDNLEALGTVVVFASGNEGPGAMTLRNPANRATTPFNTFSVGSTDTLGVQISSFSSRGPSDCDSVSIKPEVAAPGHLVRTTEVNGNYILASGTSFAAPHVAGAVALLRQVNPNATVEEIKWALMSSAVDRGDPGEDNSFGWGGNRHSRSDVASTAKRRSEHLCDGYNTPSDQPGRDRGCRRDS